MNDIYDHAPECDVAIWLERAIETDAPRWLGVPDDVACQCQKLRACEQRVRMEDDDYAYVAAQAEADGRRRGWNEALDAAREAVASAGVRKDTSYDMRMQALAAIDALRGE